MPRSIRDGGATAPSSERGRTAILRLAICDVPEHPAAGTDRVLEDAVRPRFAPSVAHHLLRFADARQRRARLLSRLLLLALLAEALPGAAAETAARLGRDAAGRPLFSGAAPLPAVSFSFSASGAACALGFGPEHGPAPALGTDLEDLGGDPPAPPAFDAHERRALRLPALIHPGPDEALRRWTVKEAALKALGAGLSRDPAAVSAGRTGARAGRIPPVRAGDPPLFWRCIPLPGRWCALAASAPFSVRARVLGHGELIRILGDAGR